MDTDHQLYRSTENNIRRMLQVGLPIHLQTLLLTCIIQMDNAKKGVWQVAKLATCYPTEARCHDFAFRELSKLA
jgi:hypothetical protein